MSQYDHSHVRARFLKSTFRNCVLPAAVVAAALRFAHIELGYFTIPVYIGTIILLACARNIYNSHIQEREASRLGARTIPRVVGKWPGNIDIVLRLVADLKSGYMQDVFLELFHEYQCTTLNLRIFWMDKLITMDHEHQKYIFATGFPHFYRGDTGYEILHSFLGKGILNCDDDIWKNHRTLARPFFANDRVSDLEVVEKHTQRVLSIISGKGRNEAIDIEELISRFTIDAGSEFLFGKSLDSLSNEVQGFDAFTEAFNNMQALCLRRNTRQGIWPLFELFEDAGAADAKTLRSWLDPIINRALEHKKNVRRMGIDKLDIDQSTFLEYLANSTENIDLMRDQLLSMLLAARDTTLALLTFTLYLLTRHPEVAKRLRQEVLEQVGPDAAPTIDNLKDLKYLRAVLNEALRLFTPLPSNLRETRSEGIVFPKSDVTFPTNATKPPLYMPPNTPILTFPFLQHRNRALWGDDAEAFNPDRWLDSAHAAKIAENPTQFTPFSLGPRLCLGQNYALNEATYFMVRMLQRFDKFELAEDKQLTPPWITDPAPAKPGVHPGSERKSVEKVWPAYTITIHVKGGLWLRFGKEQ